MTKTLPALKAYQGSHRRHDVLVISKPAEGLRGGEVGLFWDQEIGLEILRRANAYPKLVAALRDVLRDRLTQTNLHQMPPAIRARVETARNLLSELGEDA